MTCHASANLELAIPHWVPPVKDPLADNAANRGSQMHEYFANIAVLPARDIAAMSVALEYVAKIRGRRRFKVLSEHTVQANWLVVPTSTTADLVFYTSDEIHVFDLKTGKIPVAVKDNEQLLFYAASYAHLAPRANGVMLHIVQPWANGCDSWFATTTDIGNFMRDAVAAEKAVAAQDVTFTPSDHCLFCPANPHGRGLKGRPLCPAMMSMLYPPIVDEDEILGL
jgi:Protein of unknown function (DUF2800)